MKLYEKQPLDILHGFLTFLTFGLNYATFKLKAIILVPRLLDKPGLPQLRWAWLLGMQCSNIEIHMRDVSKPASAGE
jgi:hypothetical protein